VLFPDGRAFTLKVISNITPNESNGIMVEMWTESVCLHAFTFKVNSHVIPIKMDIVFEVCVA
jgi:hypothetical protein